MFDPKALQLLTMPELVNLADLICLQEEPDCEALAQIELEMKFRVEGMKSLIDEALELRQRARNGEFDGPR